MDCLVLAGGVPRPGEPLWEESRGEAKALLDVAGRPLVQWVLDALAATRGIDRVVLVGLDPGVSLRYPGGLERVAAIPGGALVDHLYSGIERLRELAPEAERAAYCWSDLPLAEPLMLERFLAAAHGLEADVVAGLVARAPFERSFPTAPEKWLRLREGEFIAADFGVFRPGAAAAARPHLARLAPRRKSAVRQALAVGLPLLLRYLAGRLAIADLERTLVRRYGIAARVLVAEDPELGLDVDGLENLAICRRRLQARVERRTPSGGGERAPVPRSGGRDGN